MAINALKIKQVAFFFNYIVFIHMDFGSSEVSTILRDCQEFNEMTILMTRWDAEWNEVTLQGTTISGEGLRKRKNIRDSQALIKYK